MMPANLRFGTQRKNFNANHCREFLEGHECGGNFLAGSNSTQCNQNCQQTTEGFKQGQNQVISFCAALGASGSHALPDQKEYFDWSA
jgi:hypothetical protein